VADKKQPLSRERILSAASRIARREGLEALSMRRLAQELDVWPMSVYTYFRDKDELIDAVAAEATREVAVASAGGDWQEQLRQLLGQVRDTIAHDPSGVGARMSRAFLSPGLLRLSEAGLSILTGAGFSGSDAARAWRALWSYTLGFAGFSLGSPASEARRLARAAIGGLPESDHPVLLEHGNEFAAAFSSEEEFGRGLDLLLAGLEARLAPAAGQPLG
jgi:AcrR family transcriptional regulator